MINITFNATFFLCVWIVLVLLLTLQIYFSTAIIHVNSSYFKDVYYLPDQEVSYGAVAIFGKKDTSASLCFKSYAERINAGFATNKQNARRKIQRKEEGWRYAHVDEIGKPIKTPYTLKPGKISYELWIQQQKNP